MTDWSPDGQRLAFHTSAMGTNSHDVGFLMLTSGAKSQVVAQSPSTDIDGRFSPDGQWIAYTSNDSGQMEVYIAPLPQLGGTQVSIAGGSEPHWRADGRELFYMAVDRKIMAVAIGRGPGPALGTPTALFATNVLFPGNAYRMNDDVAADGSRFLVSTPAEAAEKAPIMIVVNWAAGLKK